MYSFNTTLLGGREINNHTSIRETNIYDGKWHKVEFILKLGREDGYCLVTIDEEKIIEEPT